MKKPSLLLFLYHFLRTFFCLHRPYLYIVFQEVSGTFISSFISLYFLSLLPDSNIRKQNNSKANISHLFLVDDLKTFAKNKNEATIHLDLIIRRTNNISIKFGLDKCTYIYIERGKRKSLVTKLTINNIDITELESGETYKYLGQYEDIGLLLS